MPLLLLWGHGSFRSGYGSFIVPANVELQFFCDDNDEVNDDAIRFFEFGDLTNGVTDALIARARGEQQTVGRRVHAAGTIVKNYRLESLRGDLFSVSTGLKTTLGKPNVYSPGWAQEDESAAEMLKDMIAQRSHTATAADPLIVQFCACRSNYIGTSAEQASAPLPTPAVRRRRRCYITTATCQSLGLGDDCLPLQRLRWFRDNVMAETAAGRAQVEAYYATAPGIVAAIDAQPDAAGIYRAIFDSALSPALSAIEAGAYERAEAIYSAMVLDLGVRFAARSG